MTASVDKEELLRLHLQLVLKKNKTVNLTRIDDEDQARLLHIEDSLAGLPEFERAPQGPAADLGTGGGYPGIPLSIMSGRRIDLVESVTKKARALDDIVRDLSLEGQITVKNQRAETLAIDEPWSYSVVVARALSPLPSLIELASPLLAIGGLLIAYKGRNYTTELQDARDIEDKVGMSYQTTRELILSDGETRRSIITFKKAGEPLVKLPRRPGMAQKNPYKKKRA